jgi:hypothetical protein
VIQEEMSVMCESVERGMMRRERPLEELKHMARDLF